MMIEGATKFTNDTVELDFSGRQNKRQLDFKRQNENDRFFM